MTTLLKKSDFRKLFPVPLMFAAFSLVKPVCLLVRGEDVNWLEGLPGLTAVVTMVSAVYLAVLVLRIRDRRREAQKKTGLREPPT